MIQLLAFKGWGCYEYRAFKVKGRFRFWVLGVEALPGFRLLKA